MTDVVGSINDNILRSTYRVIHVHTMPGYLPDEQYIVMCPNLDEACSIAVDVWNRTGRVDTVLVGCDATENIVMQLNPLNAPRNVYPGIIPEKLYRREMLVNWFRDGLERFLAKGDRREMIVSAGKWVQSQDEPFQRELERIWDRNRRTLARIERNREEGDC